MSQPTIRPIQEEDWPVILALQAEAYYALEPEDQQVLRSKLTLGPSSSLVACLEGEVVGYCLAHPWCADKPAGLYQCYRQPAGHECLYIHDVVISPSAQGMGIARRFLTHLEALARRHQQKQLSLVAVQGADRFWARHQFQARTCPKDLGEYGEQAVYMCRTLA